MNSATTLSPEMIGSSIARRIRQKSDLLCLGMIMCREPDMSTKENRPLTVCKIQITNRTAISLGLTVLQQNQRHFGESSSAMEAWLGPDAI